MADEFVKNILAQNGLDMYISLFQKEQISEDVFPLLDSEEIGKLIPIAGHRLKLKKIVQTISNNCEFNKYEPLCSIKEVDDTKHHESAMPLEDSVNEEQYEDKYNVKEEYIEHMYNVKVEEEEEYPTNEENFIYCDSPSNDTTHEEQLSAGLFITEDIIKEILKGTKRNLYIKLERQEAEITSLDKYSINRALTDWLCQITKGYPSNAEKIKLAEVLCSAYPVLKSEKDGVEFWYKPYSYKAKASGIIELRARNWRKGLPAEDKKFVRKPIVVEDSPETTNEDADKVLPLTRYHMTENNIVDILSNTSKPPCSSTDEDMLYSESPSDCQTSYDNRDLEDISSVINRAITEDFIRKLLKDRKRKLFIKLEKKDANITLCEKYSINRAVTDWLCQVTKGYPSNREKLMLAAVLCSTYPVLKGKDIGGLDFWYKPHTYKSKASGIIELRIRNWRKGLPMEEKKFVRRPYEREDECVKAVSDEGMNKSIPLTGYHQTVKKISDLLINEQDPQCSSKDLNFTLNNTIPGVDFRLPGQPSDCNITEDMIRDILKNNKRILYSKLKNNPNLTISLREKYSINRAVTDWLCQKTKGYPSNREKLKLANVLCSTYPILKSRENGGVEFWYKPHTYKSKAAGIIELRIRNWRKKLAFEDKKFVRKSLDNQNYEDNVKEFEISDEVLEAREWLKVYNSPKELVLERMILSFNLRKFDYLNLPIKDLFLEWPHLKSAELINKDFELLKSDELIHNGLIEKFSFDVPRLLELLNCESTCLSSEAENLQAIYSLCSLLPAGNVMTKSDDLNTKKFKKHSTEEIFSSIITIHSEDSKLPDVDHNEPIVVITGAKSNPTQAFVSAGGEIIYTDSIVTAVDTLFKIYHLWNLQYPTASKNVFRFIETRYFGMKDNNYLPTCIHHLLDNLQPK